MTAESSFAADRRKPRNRNEQRAARELARETGVPYQQALMRFRAEKAAAPERMPEGSVYPFVDGARADGVASADGLTASVAERFGVSRQTARWWLIELDVIGRR